MLLQLKYAAYHEMKETRVVHVTLKKKAAWQGMSEKQTACVIKIQTDSPCQREITWGEGTEDVCVWVGWGGGGEEAERVTLFRLVVFFFFLSELAFVTLKLKRSNQNL